MADTDVPKGTTSAEIAEAIVADDPANLPPPQSEKVVVQRSNGVPAVVGGIVAAALGFGLAQFVPNGWPLQPNDALVADLAALKAEVATLQGALAAAPQPDTTLAGRISALEGAPAVDLGPLTERIAALESEPAPIVTASGGGVNVATSVLTAQAKDIAALQADVAALKAGGTISPDAEARLAEAEARAMALAAQTEADASAQRQRAALDRLEIALESGAPFATALGDIGDTPVAVVLSDNAVNGLPTLATLQASFPDVARAALEASLRAAGGETWGARAAAFLRNQTGARSLTPREGSDPDAVLSRAEAALGFGDVDLTLTEIATLPAEGQAALADWVAQTNTYLMAQKAVADLRTALNVE
jgi:hypothetical protein